MMIRIYLLISIIIISLTYPNTFEDTYSNLSNANQESSSTLSQYNIIGKDNIYLEDTIRIICGVISSLMKSLRSIFFDSITKQFLLLFS